jgi:anti-sigma-K factor RskA
MERGGKIMSPKPIAELLLERYRLGELPAAAMADLRARCEADPDLSARLEALDRSDAAILAAHPPAAMARDLLDKRKTGAGMRPSRRIGIPGGLPARPGRRRWDRKAFWAAPAGLAFACAIILAVRHLPDPGNTQMTESPEAYAVRLKGAEAGLAIFRKANGSAELLPPHSLAKPGDTLQVFYHSRGPAYGVIFSVDGAGSVTLHLPEEGGTATALQTGDLLPLPHAYRLDRAPRMERFFLITAPQPFPVDRFLEQARAAFTVRHEVPDSLPGLEEGFRQYPYTLRKPGKGGRTK